MTPEEKAAADKNAPDKNAPAPAPAPSGGGAGTAPLTGSSAQHGSASQAGASGPQHSGVGTSAQHPSAGSYPGHPEPFVFAGRRAGAAFGITGEQFGSSGSLTIGKRPIPTTLWSDKDIRGTLPADVQPGEIVVTGGTGVVQKGTWPPPHPAPTTTVTTTTVTKG